MTSLLASVPHDLLLQILQQLSMRSLAHLASASVALRAAALGEMLGRLSASDFGKRWVLRADLLLSSLANYRKRRPDGSWLPKEVLMVGALDETDATRYCNCPARCDCHEPPSFYKVKIPEVIGAPRGIWRRFIFGHRQDAVAPAEHPTGAAHCARSIHVCNVWIRAARMNSYRAFDHCEEYDITPPTRYLAHVVSPAYARASIKRALQANAVISCLADVASIMSDRDKQAVQDFDDCLDDPSTVQAASFAVGSAVLSHDNWSCSWAVWAVYEGLIPTLVAVALGLADLDCPVPALLAPSDSHEWPVPDEHVFQPLRVWLQQHRGWISAEVVRLFQLAAGEAPDLIIDDESDEAVDAAIHPDDYDFSDSEDDLSGSEEESGDSQDGNE